MKNVVIGRFVERLSRLAIAIPSLFSQRNIHAVLSCRKSHIFGEGNLGAVYMDKDRNGPINWERDGAREGVWS